MIAQLRRQALADVSVIAMRRRHLRSVLGIEHQVYPRPWSPALFAAELQRPESRRYVVALAPRSDAGPLRRMTGGREVVGYAGLILEPSGVADQRRRWAHRPFDEAHITTVAVHPHHHRRKVASRLLHALLSEARRAGAQAATLEVRAANRGAQRFYTGFGFAPVGVRPGYYAETREDAVIMWLYDLQGDEAAARLAEQAARFVAPGGTSGAPDFPVPWVRGRRGLGDG